MDAIAQLNEMREDLKNVVSKFEGTMAVHQSRLATVTATSASPLGIATLSEEFSRCQDFVRSTMDIYNKQLSIIAAQLDGQEMKSRVKSLLLHGISEKEKEDTDQLIEDTLVSRLDIKTTYFVSKRLGPKRPNKTRPILVYFDTRRAIWNSKTKLKGSGITMSEFLTKSRHAVFVEARKRFDVRRCWTTEGRIVVLKDNGSRVLLDTMEDLLAVAESEGVEAGTSRPASTTRAGSPSRRPRRNASKIRK